MRIQNDDPDLDAAFFMTYRFKKLSDFLEIFPYRVFLILLLLKVPSHQFEEICA